LDVNDTFYPTVLPLLAEAVSSEGVAFAFGESHLTYADSTQKHWQPAPWPEGLVEAGVIPDLWLATGHHHVSLSATMWKAVYLHANGG
jgi:hypothetical protein